MSWLFNILSKIPRPSKKTLLLIAITAAATLAVSTTVSFLFKRYSNLNLPSIGTIEATGIRVYSDADLQEEVEEIDWGTIYSGSSNSISLYMHNFSNANLTLELITANWTFLNSENIAISEPSNITSHINLTWNYSNTPLSPYETIQVTLTLSVDDSLDLIKFIVSNDVTHFTFNTVIHPST